MKKKGLDIIGQSKNAYRHHAENWRAHAKAHSVFAPFKPLSNFMNSGVGKALILVANGHSLEIEFDVLKANREGHDIMCCDKSLGTLIERGIKPDFVMVCDANVNYEKYMEPWKDQLDQTTLFVNVCANPKWAMNGSWKDKYFFVNFDSIRSEVEFSKLSGCMNMIPAATNVSNAMVVMATQSDNTGRKNFFGYDKIILLGFDFCWTQEGSYYAFDKRAQGKFNYMRHVYALGRMGEMVYTSTNLAFSSRWLEQYLKSFNLPVVNCSTHSILGGVPHKPLKSQIPYSYRREDSSVVSNDLKKRDVLMFEVQNIEKRLAKIGQDHWLAFRASI